MKTTVRLILLLAACLAFGGCAGMRPARWEYKVVTAPPLPDSVYQTSGTNANMVNWAEQRREVSRKSRENQERFLNELGKDGWMLTTEQEGTFYLRRRLR
jgi:hypothetical protein